MTGRERRDLNINGYSFFLNNVPVKTFSLGETEILLGASDHLWAYIFSASPRELSSLLPEVMKETLFFAAVDEWACTLLCEKRRVDWILKTDRFIFPERGDVEAPEIPVEYLRAEDAETIYAESGYQAYADAAYIRERILSGPAVCIRKGGELAAWAMTHDDGALGILQVRPPWRREHLAENLVRFLIREKQRKKEPLFLNIEPENHASQSLARKIGFQKEKVILWLKLGEECSLSSG